jgi:hypothetical protein
MTGHTERTPPYRFRRRPQPKVFLERLIVFARYPEPGKTKTRLMGAIGPRGAAETQRLMAEHALNQLRKLRKHRPLFIDVHHDGGNQGLMETWLGRGFSYTPQNEGDLGRRMLGAFSRAFRSSAHRVVLVGTDCPGVTEKILEDAFEGLGDADVVLGPTRDGGYYLIGLRRPVRDLFVAMPWGTDQVLDKTKTSAERIGLRVFLLKQLTDVDRPEDLWVWEEIQKKGLAPAPSPVLSVVIPTLNEAENIADTLESTQGASNVDVMVVDGGSEDKTVEIARSHGVKILEVSGGRARQMNRGAAKARGEVLLFLHGDTRLPEGYDEAIYCALNRPRAVAGAFRLRIEGHRPGLRFIEQTANWRSQLLGLPYGDQGIFMSAGLFRSVGGFPEFPIMEDFELMRRLRRLGRVVIAPALVSTSDRRWQALGVWQTTLTNYAIPIGYLLGVSPSRLATWYRRRKGAP